MRQNVHSDASQCVIFDKMSISVRYNASYSEKNRFPRVTMGFIPKKMHFRVSQCVLFRIK